MIKRHNLNNLIYFLIFIILILFVTNHNYLIAQEKSKSTQKESVQKKDDQSKQTPKSGIKQDKNAEELICIVSGEEADPELKMEYKGKTYYFCCKKCVKKFKENPEKYIKN